MTDEAVEQAHGNNVIFVATLDRPNKVIGGGVCCDQKRKVAGDRLQCRRRECRTHKPCSFFERYGVQKDFSRYDIAIKVEGLRGCWMQCAKGRQYVFWPHA